MRHFIIEAAFDPEKLCHSRRRWNWIKFAMRQEAHTPMADHPRVILDPSICHGKPVIRGSRVPVTVVVGSLAGGMTFEEIEHEYDLTAEDIRAALKFVGELAEQESFHPLPAG